MDSRAVQHARRNAGCVATSRFARGAARRAIQLWGSSVPPPFSSVSDNRAVLASREAFRRSWNVRCRPSGSLCSHAWTSRTRDRSSSRIDARHLLKRLLLDTTQYEDRPIAGVGTRRLLTEGAGKFSSRVLLSSSQTMLSPGEKKGMRVTCDSPGVVQVLHQRMGSDPEILHRLGFTSKSDVVYSTLWVLRGSHDREKSGVGRGREHRGCRVRFSKRARWINPCSP